MKEFLKHHQKRTNDKDRERSWYVEKPQEDTSGTVAGLLHYGSYGFTSKLLDGVSNAKRYDRLASDVEQIPLIYKFWKPKNSDYLLVALQSFGVRSCVDLVQGGFRLFAEKKWPKHSIRFRKVMPNDSKGSLFGSAPVKRLVFVSPRANSDIADRLSPFKPTSPVDIEVVIKARRRSTLCALADVMDDVTTKDGVIMHEGLEFREAFADIRVGGRARKVGIIGPSADTGTIDLSDGLKIVDGHLVYADAVKEIDAILADFHEKIGS
ncbi:hypothetical protein [Sphingomonas antarctica]|uniref:hypothetical protein n=1 Tax=Sphingomonas antarctica TaxID=2040274 RepID=UPI0039ED2BBA